MLPCTTLLTVCAYVEGDHLVKYAADLVALVHVADRHAISIDHAGQLDAWSRLADHAQAGWTDQSNHAARRTATPRRAEIGAPK